VECTVSTARPITILLADGQRVVRQGIAALIRQQPDLSVAAEADDCLAAVSLAVSLRPDVALVGVTTPALPVVAATRRILSGSPGTRVLGLATHAEIRLAAEMLSVGASGYLLADCSFDELAGAIRTISAGGRLGGAPGEDLGGSARRGQAAAPSAAPRSCSVLTSRECEVLRLLAEGRRSSEIARALGLSAKTVETHRAKLMNKLAITTIAGLTRYAVCQGLVSSKR
jgi:DNA-binding NarL/FixJ family response regulator